MNWPTQSGCDAFYGNPRGSTGTRANPNWYAHNIVEIAPPFKMHMDRNPLTIPASTIRDCLILETIIAGVPVYRP